jgi:chromate reductase, NAD(P)H dehydrogenase (quinone)
MRILAISGSLRDGSYNTLLLRAAEQQAPAGVEFDRYDALEQVPPFHGDRSSIAPVPDAVRDLQERIQRADAVLIATPEYNGSIPGQLKNALDWASTPFPDNAFKGKPVAVIGASTGGYGGMWAQAELKKVLGVTGARVVGAKVVDELTHEYAAIAA